MIAFSPARAQEPEVRDSTEIDSLRIISDDEPKDEKQVAATVFVSQYKPRFQTLVEGLFSDTRIIHPDSLPVRYREFDDMLVGESFLPVIIGPPGLARTVFIDSNPSSNPYINFNGAMIPETYWLLPHFRGPDLNSFPTEAIESVALVDGAGVLVSGYNPGPEILDIRNHPVSCDVDTEYTPLTSVCVLRGPYQYERTGIVLTKKGPYDCNLRAIGGIVSSIGYLPYSEYRAHYYGLTIARKIGRFPIELSGYRYIGRGEYTVLDYTIPQKPKFSRDLINLTAKSRYSWSSSAISMELFANRRPHTALDHTLGLYYRTINTIVGGKIDFERKSKSHLIFAGFKTYYEKMRNPYLFDPEMIRGSITLGDIIDLSGNNNYSLLALGRYDLSDDKGGGLSGALGLSAEISPCLRLYSTVYRQAVFPDLHTLYWPPWSYQQPFDLGVYTYSESGNPNLPVAYQDGIEAGTGFDFDLLKLNIGGSYIKSVDMIQYQNRGTPFNIDLYPFAVDYDRASVYFRLYVKNFEGFWGRINGRAGVRYSEITYDDDYRFGPIPKIRAYAGGSIQREWLVKGLMFRAAAEIDYFDERYVSGFHPIYEDYYWIVNVSYSATYKDFTFYYNGENVADLIYYSNGANPVLGTIYWYGIKWNFWN
jgi:hypothetical protein